MNKLLLPIAVVVIAALALYAILRSDETHVPSEVAAGLRVPDAFADGPVAIERAPTPGARPALVRCRLIDADTRRPVVGALAGASDDALAIAYAPVVVSDANGSIAVELHEGRGRGVTVLARGYAPIVLLPDATIERVELLVPNGSLIVRVSDSNGIAVAGVHVRLEADTARLVRASREVAEALVAGMRPAVWSAVTNERGIATFVSLPEREPFEAFVVRDDRVIWRPESRSVSLRTGAPADLTWRIGTACTIAGKALEHDGSPARDESIALQRAERPADTHGRNAYFVGTRRTAISDVDGSFSFDFVDTGDWWVLPGRADWTRTDERPDRLAESARYVRVDAGAQRVDVVLPVIRGLTIRAVVLDPEGYRTNARVTASALDEKDDLWSSAIVDDPSEVGPLLEGRHRLVARSRWFAPSLPVDTSTGAEPVTLRMRAPASITGVAIDATTHEPVDAVARVVTVADDERALVVSTTMEHGRFVFEGLPPGAHAVVATTSDGRCGGIRTTLELAEKRADVVVAVGPGARLRCANDHAWRALSIGVVHDDVDYGGDTIESGGAVDLTVPAGRSRVTVRDRIGRVVRTTEVTLAVGETRRFVMSADPR